MELKALIASVAARVDAVMRDDIDRLAGELDPLLAEILDYGLFGGGKRVRPLLTVLTGRLCGADDENLYRLAASFEYLHAATLFHDDIIDGADERRGREPVHRRFGFSAAILAGDFLHTHAMALVGRHGGTGALDVFCRATRGMVDGEFVQLRNARNLNQSEADYFTAVRRKTALLIGAACEIGARYGGADDEVRSGLHRYGVNLGIAFQIVDDLLDYLGDPSATGKAVGGDLSEANMTLPLIYCLQRASEQDRKRLTTMLSDDGLRRDRLPEVRVLIDACNGFSDARRRAEEFVAEATAALRALSRLGPAPELTALDDLAGYVLNRKT